MSNQENRYFNLYTNGIGYLNRVQEVTPTDGSRFVAVTIAALRGSVEKAQYTYFECRVSGREAQETVRLLTPMVNAKRKVLIGFRLSDLRAETFTFKNGERAGQTGISPQVEAVADRLGQGRRRVVQPAGGAGRSCLTGPETG